MFVEQKSSLVLKYLQKIVSYMRSTNIIDEWQLFNIFNYLTYI